MTLENYCKKCGHRILPNEPYCPGCGCKTIYHATKDDYVFTPPIHNIGFFNFDIDFSPYILSKSTDFKYEICACGYLNHVDNEYCYMCGSKRSQSTFSKIFRKNSKPEFSIDNVLCECGAINPKENVFCEMCGRKLRSQNVETDNYSNFNLEFKNPKFCFCGEENDKFALFCRNCGLPLQNYGKLNDSAILCTCSTLNEITSSFCTECGANLSNEHSLILCVCGHKNPMSAKFCRNCQRPLNPQRVVKSKIVCSCGEILDWNTEFCPNCGNNVKNRKLLRKSVKSLKNMLR